MKKALRYSIENGCIPQLVLNCSVCSLFKKKAYGHFYTKSVTRVWTFCNLKSMKRSKHWFCFRVLQRCIHFSAWFFLCTQWSTTNHIISHNEYCAYSSPCAALFVVPISEILPKRIVSIGFNSTVRVFLAYVTDAYDANKGSVLLFRKPVAYFEKNIYLMMTKTSNFMKFAYIDQRVHQKWHC